MYYEIYADSLLLLNITMNLFCLELVNILMLRTATRRRVFLGAVLGAFLYFVPFVLSTAVWIKIVVFFPLSVVFMIAVVFRPVHLKPFFALTKLLLAASFLFGGALLGILRFLPPKGKQWGDLTAILSISTLLFLEAMGLIQARRRPRLCKVELVGKGARITVNALVDTGNTLTEPVSGKPVCILEKSVFEGLWRSGGPEGFRVIPYHSVGRERGILYGYPLPEIIIENQGMLKRYKDVYVGIVEEKIARTEGYRMILNPMIFDV